MTLSSSPSRQSTPLARRGRSSSTRRKSQSRWMPLRPRKKSCSARPCVRSNGLLVARRWRESDEDDDAVTARIPAKVDINIGFPVVDGPNVASLVDDHRRLTHHWDKTGGSALTV